MTARSRVISAAMAVLLALAGPFTLVAGPGVAFAQSQPQAAGQAGGGQTAGSIALNVVYVPGKAIICSVGTLGSAVLMLITFGSAYREAVRVFNEGCSGDWVLTEAHVAGQVPPPEQSN